MISKIQQAMQDDAIQTTRIHPAFILVTGMKCLYGKTSNQLTEISVGKTEILATDPARPHMNTGFRGKARSRKPGSCEEALSKV